MTAHLVFLTGLLLAASPTFVNAQSVSAADISAMIDERMSSVDEYAELLNDPDPERSVAAMQIMIGLDDPQIKRMALQYGLTSTSSAVRRAALQAYFDTAPVLNIFIDGSSLERDSLTTYLTRRNGTVDASGTAFLSYKVGEYDEKEGCYDFQIDPNYCLVTLAESNVAITLWGRPTPVFLDSEGNLTGMVLVDRMTPSVPMTIPVQP